MTDAELQPIRERSLIIKPPPGVVIDSGAAKIHGISNERAHDEGVDIGQALSWFADECCFIRNGGDSDNPGMHVAYNLPFDDQIMTSAWARTFNVDEVAARASVFAGTVGECAMKMTNGYLRIPADNGGWRPIKLTQAYRRITGFKMPEAHDALGDVKGTLTIFKAILETSAI